MTVFTLPRQFIRSASWQQTDQRRTLQRSEWTGRTREMVIGPADRWACAADIRPMQGADLTMWRAFQTQMKQPQGFCRVPAVESRQLPGSPNIIANPDLQFDSTGWVLPANVGRVADVWPSPVDFFFRADPGSARSILANSGANWPAVAGQRLFIESWAFRTDTGVTCNVALQWRNASDTVISTDTLVLAPTPGGFALVRGNALAPAGTAFVRVRYDIGAFASGYLAVTGLRVALLPTACAVSGAANVGQTLALTGLGPGLLHLRAGQLITVPLSATDEQLIPLLADLIADGSGNATAQLGSPLRSTPAAGSVVELDQPWGLMRASDPLAWSVDPAPIYAARQMQFEEAF